MNHELLIYPIHGAYWAAFGLAGWILDRRARLHSNAPEVAPVAQTEATAPYSRAVLAIHFLAFGVMYFGLGNSVIPNRVTDWFPGQRIVGTLLIAAGAWFMVWARCGSTPGVFEPSWMRATSWPREVRSGSSAIRSIWGSIFSLSDPRSGPPLS
jgi:hypothetical protein